MLFSSVKEINRLIIKGMSNINLKVIIGKNRRFQNVDFLSLRNSSRSPFLGISKVRVPKVIFHFFDNLKYEIKNYFWFLVLY